MSSAAHRIGGLAAMGVGIFIAAGCAPDRHDEEPHLGVVRYAIADGYEDADDTAVVGILQPSMGRLCTGTLIAPNVVLTAGHCVAPTFGDEAGVLCGTTELGKSDNPNTFWVSTAATVELASAAEFFVQEVVRVPAEDTQFCGNDAAALILKENVPSSVALPREPQIESQPVGVVYSAIGYGGTDNGGTGSGVRRRRDDLTVECVAAECEDSQVVEEEWIGGGGVCRGDSGGPAIDEQGRIIGIASRGSSTCDLSLYVGTYAWREWLQDTVVYASGAGVYEAPTWTAGSSVNPEYSMPIGDACDAPMDCPSNRCLEDGDDMYCTRICDEEHECPEDYTCGEALGQMLCLSTPPEPPPPFKRAETDDCSVSQAGGPVRGYGWLLALSLPLLVLRRRGAAAL